MFISLFFAFFRDVLARHNEKDWTKLQNYIILLYRVHDKFLLWMPLYSRIFNEIFASVVMVFSKLLVWNDTWTWMELPAYHRISCSLFVRVCVSFVEGVVVGRRIRKYCTFDKVLVPSAWYKSLQE